MFHFRRNCQTFSQRGCIIYPTVDSIAPGAASLLPWVAGVSLFDYSPSDGCVVLSPCGSNLHFLITNDVEHFFHVLIGHSAIYIFDSSNLLPIFNSFFVFLLLKCHSSLYILDNSPLLDICFANDSSKSVGLTIHFLNGVFWWAKVF